MIIMERNTMNKGITATLRCRLKSLNLGPSAALASSLLARRANKPITAMPKTAAVAVIVTVVEVVIIQAMT